jgi:hypothetical protein
MIVLNYFYLYYYFTQIMQSSTSYYNDMEFINNIVYSVGHFNDFVMVIF